VGRFHNVREIAGLITELSRDCNYQDFDFSSLTKVGLPTPTFLLFI
jgi:hypothetical protein